MKQLNPTKDGFVDPAQVFLTLYIDGSIVGSLYSTLTQAEKDRLAPERGGVILRIARTSEGDFITSIAKEF